ncbi:uncharacterized protein BDR25DRAFT_395950 [Lindgomyces ingoldianus]|uniref:Uncharacterized protein n=1 Tax=Lindgomyces ingoldianus TaxID=673940 RepID=A0ACB6QJ54_9PLEO|nr:uncharacterized protein BDR25DRAFT_395950 [Lindgomyces ingoldianus]KAF2466176.1 hypothetical protein BDR25DRAFT_395950 [Lindgomyces ingoldianus]
MVLGILTAIAACPAIIGTTEAVRQGQKQNAKEKHRGLKTNLIVNCSRFSEDGREVDGCEIVLSSNKVRWPPNVSTRINPFWLYLAMSTEEYPDGCPEDHPFAGYFLPFPDKNWGRLGEGFVSTISDDPPQLNWIYVDQDTHEVKHGNREESEPHLVGPWDVTKMDRRVTFEGWEGFMAVKYGPGEWALYFDRDDNGLEGILAPEMVREEVVLGVFLSQQNLPTPLLKLSSHCVPFHIKGERLAAMPSYLARFAPELFLAVILAPTNISLTIRLMLTLTAFVNFCLSLLVGISSNVACSACNGIRSEVEAKSRSDHAGLLCTVSPLRKLTRHMAYDNTCDRGLLPPRYFPERLRRQASRVFLRLTVNLIAVKSRASCSNQSSWMYILNDTVIHNSEVLVGEQTMRIQDLGLKRNF